MGYYTRAFCTSEQVPSIGGAIDWVKDKRGYTLVPDAETSRDASDWEQVELTYKEGKQALIVECNRNDSESSLCSEECKEFIELLADNTSAEADTVKNHLAKTRFVISSRLLSDIDDDGYDANWAFLEFFAKEHNGIVQTDGEGFYKESRLIVELV